MQAAFSTLFGAHRLYIDHRNTHPQLSLARSNRVQPLLDKREYFILGSRFDDAAPTLEETLLGQPVIEQGAAIRKPLCELLVQRPYDPEACVFQVGAQRRLRAAVTFLRL